MSGSHTQIGFHVKKDVASPDAGVDVPGCDDRGHAAQFPVQQSALRFATPEASGHQGNNHECHDRDDHHHHSISSSVPIPHLATGSLSAGKLYRISSANARLGPSSMSPGLAMSQGDMTLADHSHLTPGVKKMMRSVVRGLKAYQDPEAATEGLGGTYFFKSETGSKIAIMKPCDEEPMAPSNPKGFRGRQLGEPGLKPTVRVGEAASREVAAYLLDHDGRAGVPHTVMVRMAHPIFHYDDEYECHDCGHEGAEKRDAREEKNNKQHVAEHEDNGDGRDLASELPLKLGSLQSFVRHECDTTEMGPKFFDKKDVHRIGILDVRLFNTDRHGGNILVQRIAAPKVGTGAFGNLGNLSNRWGQHNYKLVPIDHGFALPEGLEPPFYEWQHWPQAMMPFDKEELAYIASLDAKADVELLRKELPDIHEASFRVLELATLLLQKAAAAGLTLSEIAGVLTRPICIDEEPSELERMCFEIRQEMYMAEVERLRRMSDAGGSIGSSGIARALDGDRAASYLSSITLDEVAEGDAVDLREEAHAPEEDVKANNEPPLLSAYLSVNMDDVDQNNDSTPTIVRKSLARKPTDSNTDGLFSMDEDGGAKTPAPGSPVQTSIRGKEGMYIEAPTLRVKSTGEVEHLNTPFGTTFKSVLGGATGSSPSYDSESPTHPMNDLIEVDDLNEVDSDIATAAFRGAQSYVPTISNIPISAGMMGLNMSVNMNLKDRCHSTHPAGKVPRTSTMDVAMEQPRGCYEPSFVLKDMSEREWAVFMAKAEEKIADKLASGAWVDSFGSHQMVQMSCPV